MSHAPKLFALEALAAGLLSEAGQARLEAHLAGCATCRAAQQAVTAYARLRDAAHADQPADLAWERLEAALDGHEAPRSLEPAGNRPRPAPAPLRRGRAMALAWPVLAVAATALVIWIGLSGQERAAELAQHAPVLQPVAREQAAALEGVLTLVAGPVERERAGLREPVVVGEAVREGDRLFTGERGALHVALADGSGFMAEASSELWAKSLRQDAVVLALLRGELSSQVRKLGAAQRYIIEGHSFSAHVRGTRFSVREGAGFAVRVAEGRVEVMQGSTSIAMLEAGQAWESTSGAGRTPEREPCVYGVGVAMDGWSSLTLPLEARVLRWQIDALSVPASAQLAMRMPTGSQRISFEDLHGKLHTVSVEVLPEGSRLAESVLDQELAPRPEPVGFLPPEQISEVVRKGLSRLRQCYERSLRHDPKFESKPVLAIRVAPDGHVARASLSAEALPEALERCVVNEARTWQFPRPEGGGPLSFEVPLNLRARE